MGLDEVTKYIPSRQSAEHSRIDRKLPTDSDGRPYRYCARAPEHCRDQESNGGSSHSRQDIASSAQSQRSKEERKDTFRLSEREKTLSDFRNFRGKLSREKMSASRESDSESRQRTTKRRRDVESFCFLPPTLHVVDDWRSRGLAIGDNDYQPS